VSQAATIFGILISDISEEEYTSGELDDPPVPAAHSSGHPAAYDRAWLREQCIGVAYRNSGLDAQSLQEQVEAVLTSESHGQLVA